MSDGKKIKYITKTVKFGSQSLTLYSLDGTTWSTRKDELKEIIDRHEAEKVTFGEIRGQLNGNKVIVPKTKEKFRKQFKRVHAEPGEEIQHPAVAMKAKLQAEAKEKLALTAVKGSKSAPKVVSPVEVKAGTKGKPAPKPKFTKKVQQVAPKKRAALKAVTAKGAGKSKGKKRAA